jgi:hypothetical protein
MEPPLQPEHSIEENKSPHSVASVEPSWEEQRTEERPSPPSPSAEGVLPILPLERLEPVPVERNDSFWKDIRERLRTDFTDDAIRGLASEIDAKLATSQLLAFDNFRKSADEKFIRIDKAAEFPAIWFVGDLHGDWLALESVVHCIGQLDREGKGGPSIIVFLGDLFDRGKHSAQVLFRVLSFVNAEPGRIGFIVGNHDEGLTKGDDGKFTSSVQPSEFSDWLNEQSERSPWRELAEVTIRFFAYAPRVLLLPDGLLVAHGGVPHTDRQDRIQTQEDLNGREILEDFVWTRLHETAKRRIPNRTTRGCSLGINDFNLFCEKVGRILDRPIRGMLRGHDHLEEGFRFFDKYETNPVLTINTMCCRHPGEIGGPIERPAVFSKWHKGTMPVVHILNLPGDLVADVYGSKSSVAAE